jgi:hypothetical protein
VFNKTGATLRGELAHLGLATRTANQGLIHRGA